MASTFFPVLADRASRVNSLLRRDPMLREIVEDLDRDSAQQVCLAYLNYTADMPNAVTVIPPEVSEH